MVFFALWVLFVKISREKNYHGQKKRVAVLSGLSFRNTEVRSQITRLGCGPFEKRKEGPNKKSKVLKRAPKKEKSEEEV